MRVLLFIFALLLLVSPSKSYSASKEVKGMVENIHWLGHDVFKIQGKDVTVFTDPFKLKKIRQGRYYPDYP